MPFVARTRAAIRDSLLADWSARYTANSRALDVSVGSDAYMEAEAIAVELELFEAQGSALDREILPDQATYTLPRHGFVEGITQIPAVAAVLPITITGTALGSVTFTGRTVVSSSGIVYAVSANADGTGSSITLDGGGLGSAYATAQTKGATGNLPSGAILTWASAPTNASPTVTTSAVPQTTGADTESQAEYAARIIAHRQERPAGGNRADWQAWVTAPLAAGSDACVYPLLHPTYGTGTPGAVTVVALGPPQGTSTTNTRIVGGGSLTTIAGYIEGTNDVLGELTPLTGVQLRPVTMASGDYSIEAATPDSQDVELQCVFGSAYAPPWTYNAGYVAVAGSTQLIILIATDLTGIFVAGTKLLANLGTSNARGGYTIATVASSTYSAPNTHVTVTVGDLSVAPVTGSIIIPAPPNWAQMQAAVFDYFDALGPGDTSPACRWPSEEVRLRSKVYKSALAASVVQSIDNNGRVVCGVQGVLSASTVTPGSDVTPAAKHIVTLGVLSVHV
jgi:uncharacterized phage protein gp47/JayE